MLSHEFLIRRHIHAVINLHPALAKAVVVPIVEAVLNAAPTLIGMFKRSCHRNHVMPFSQPEKQGDGYYPTNPTQGRSCDLAYVFLEVNPCFKVAENMVCIGRNAYNPNIPQPHPHELLRQLATQMKTMRHDPITQKFTGKVGNYTNDDLAQAFLMTLFAISIHCRFKTLPYSKGR